MSSPTIETPTTQTSTERTWSIPDDITSFVSEKCSKGSYLVCSVCSKFDVDERGFGLVKMRGNFWISYFKDHLRSSRHKNNCQKKALHDAGNKLRSENCQPPNKRLKQSVLPFATRSPNPLQVRDRIVGGVCPTLVSPACPIITID